LSEPVSRFNHQLRTILSTFYPTLPPVNWLQ